MQLCLMWLIVCGMAPAWSPAAEPQPFTYRVPAGTLPNIGAWFWKERELEPEGYRAILDAFAEHSPYNLLTVSTRVKNEVVDEDVYQQVKKAAAYARQKGMGMAMNIDVRMARAAFQKRYPNEQQEMIRLVEVPLKDSGTVSAKISPLKLGDHMTGGTTPYVCLGGRVARVYRYTNNGEGIDPASVRDITGDCRVIKADAELVEVSMPCSAETKNANACLLAAFTHFTPDVFAPHLLSFWDELFRKYGDIKLAGAMIDEWGFPPSQGSLAGNDLWYSKFFAGVYAERTGGRDLLRDCLLMCFEERGRRDERVAAINRYLELNRLRNAEIEEHFYTMTKKVFGPDSFVAVHATWWPDVCPREFKKNGLDWWVARRDIAQTDESAPWCVRTSLCKKMGSPVCYNQYYNPKLDPYLNEVWSDALAGGRVNYHPQYPRPKNMGNVDTGHTYLLRGPLMRAECRVRLLNFIAKSSADCPVAVIFGHACAMNWAGPSHGEAGVKLSEQLRALGYPADLIPSSEIGSSALRVGEDGALYYGAQRYEAVVLYHPEFEKAETARLFLKIAAGGKMLLYRTGSWTTDFDGHRFDGNSALPSSMVPLADDNACVQQLVGDLDKRGIEKQESRGPTKVGVEVVAQGPLSPRRGQTRLIDGTRIIIAAEKDPAGDPIQQKLKIGSHEVEVDAQGVVGVRLTPDGHLDALAAGGLKSLHVGDTNIHLSARADVALWRGSDGKWHGVLQDFRGEVPPALAALTKDWLRLDVPPPLAESEPSK